MDFCISVFNTSLQKQNEFANLMQTCLKRCHMWPFCFPHNLLTSDRSETLIRPHKAKTKLFYLRGIMDPKVFQNQTWFIYDPLCAKQCHLLGPDWPLWKCVVNNPPSWLMAHLSQHFFVLQKCIYCSKELLIFEFIKMCLYNTQTLLFFSRFAIRFRAWHKSRGFQIIFAVKRDWTPTPGCW